MDEIKKKLYVSVSIILLIVLSGTVGFYLLLDGVTLVEAFYFTIVTIATVGYGDISPHSNIPKESFRHGLGEVYTAVLIILGISAFLYALGVVTEQVVSGELQRERRRRRMQKLIGRLRSHYVVCGGGETGTTILRELERTARRSVLIEQSEDRIRELQKEFPRLLFVAGDATLDRVLMLAGLGWAAAVVAALPDEKDNLIVVITANQRRRELPEGFRLLAKVINLGNMEPKMRSAGADVVISPGSIAGRRMVSEMFRPAVTTFLDRMLRDPRAVMRVEEVRVRRGSPLVGSPLASARIPHKAGLLVVAIQKPGQRGFLCNPEAGQVLEEGDALVVMGDMRQVQALRGLAEVKG